MIWTQKTKYCYESETGHRIAICRVNGKLLYTLYSPKKKWLGMYESPEKARNAGAQTDANSGA